MKKHLLLVLLLTIAALALPALAASDDTDVDMSFLTDDSPVYVTVNAPVAGYIKAAGPLYRADPDYTVSVIGQYTGAASAQLDRPKPVTLSWSAATTPPGYDGEPADSAAYTLTLTEDATGETQTFTGITGTSYDLVNLKTGVKYRWSVTGGGETVREGTFRTADNMPRLLSVDGVRNVRDIGGFTGLNQGLVYRGGKMDHPTPSSDFQITDAGRAVLADRLGVRTDLDFRSSTEVTVTSSPLDENVQWLHIPIGSYDYLLSKEYIEPFHDVFAVFADSDNYPVYMHCVGGADRTGTAAFVLEALCGVPEAILSMDFELTSFAVWGLRERTSNAQYGTNYTGLIETLKDASSAPTLAGKAEEILIDHLGLTFEEVANIRAMLKGNGVTFEQPQDLYCGGNNDVTLKGLGEHTVKDVTVNGVSVPFTLTGETVSFTPGAVGSGEIVFDDDTALAFKATELPKDYTVTYPAALQAGYITIAAEYTDIFESIKETLTVTDENGAPVAVTPFEDALTLRIPLSALESGRTYTLSVAPDGQQPTEETFTLGAPAALITLSPRTSSLKKAAGEQLTAALADPSVTPIYSVMGNTSAETRVLADGYLIIGTDETAAAVTVKAASPYEPTLCDSVSVTVLAAVDTTAGTRANPIRIGTADDFIAFANALQNGTNYSGKYLLQTADIDLAGTAFAGVESSKYFYGNYDGGGHLLNVALQSANDVNIFPHIGGSLFNLGVTGSVTVTAASSSVYTGGLARAVTGNARLINCYSTVTLSAPQRIGIAPSVYGLCENTYFGGKLVGGGKPVFTATTTSTRFVNTFFTTDCGGKQSYEGVAALEPEIAETDLAGYLNAGLRQAAEDGKGRFVVDPVAWTSTGNGYPTFARPALAVTAYADGTAVITAAEAGDVTVMIAGFDASGRLAGATVTTAALAAGVNTVRVTPVDAKTVKMFVFDSTETLKPLCAPYAVA